MGGGVPEGLGQQLEVDHHRGKRIAQLVGQSAGEFREFGNGALVLGGQRRVFRVVCVMIQGDYEYGKRSDIRVPQRLRRSPPEDKARLMRLVEDPDIEATAQSVTERMAVPTLEHVVEALLADSDELTRRITNGLALAAGFEVAEDAPGERIAPESCTCPAVLVAVGTKLVGEPVDEIPREGHVETARDALQFGDAKMDPPRHALALNDNGFPVRRWQWRTGDRVGKVSEKVRQAIAGID